MQKIGKLCLLIAIVIIFFLACDPSLFFPPQDDMELILDLIQSFEGALNGEERSTLYTFFHPDDTEMYDQVKDPVFFETSPLSVANRQFTIEITGNADGSTGRKILDGTLEHNFKLFTARFIMLMSEGQWLIEELVLLENEEETWAVRQIRV